MVFIAIVFADGLLLQLLWNVIATVAALVIGCIVNERDHGAMCEMVSFEWGVVTVRTVSNVLFGLSTRS